MSVTRYIIKSYSRVTPLKGHPLPVDNSMETVDNSVETVDNSVETVDNSVDNSMETVDNSVETVDNSVETVDNSVDNSVDNYPQRKRKTKITPYIKKKKYKDIIIIIPERGPKRALSGRDNTLSPTEGEKWFV